MTFHARVPAWLMPVALRAVHLQARLLHPMTLGVRAAVFDAQDRVFLVKHSYVPGWHIPGGGVEPGETTTEAIARELKEEARIVPTATPALHGIFFNRGASRRDHVVVYVVREFQVQGPRPPDWEILGAQFFALSALPDDTARSTLSRIREIRESLTPASDW